MPRWASGKSLRKDLTTFNGEVSATSPGRLIARVLAGAWRQHAEPLSITAEELSLIAPLLLSTGAAALAWRQTESLDLPQARSLSDLQEGYRKHTIEAALHELQVKDIFKRMRSTGVEPVLFKGWALARLYPAAGLRPYGDIDLWLPPEQREDAEAALRSRMDRIYGVDLHTSFYPQLERTVKDVRSRSLLVPLDGVNIRTPCPEDHLRFLCLHFLFHGGWRPLWLCDIALTVESRAEDFDWDRCLRGKKRHADWVVCTIGLAHELLGAEVTGTPVEKRARNLPSWLVPAVLEQWSAGSGMSQAENLSFSAPRALLRPGRLVNALREHWRNPLQATVEIGASFDELPRAPVQLAAAFLHVPRLARELGQQWRRQAEVVKR